MTIIIIFLITLSFSMFFQDVNFISPQKIASPHLRQSPVQPKSRALPASKRQDLDQRIASMRILAMSLEGHVEVLQSIQPPDAWDGYWGWDMEVLWSPWWFFGAPQDILYIYMFIYSMIYVISGMHLNLIKVFFGFPMNFPDHIPWYDHCVTSVSWL